MPSLKADWNCQTFSTFRDTIRSSSLSTQTSKQTKQASRDLVQLYLRPRERSREILYMAFALSLALDPTFGVHSLETLDTAQPCHLSKPNWKSSSSDSIPTLTNISTQFLLQSVCVCVCVFVVLFYIFIILYVNCFGRTMLYMCIEYHI